MTDAPSEPRMQACHHRVAAALGCLLLGPVALEEWKPLLAELQAGLAPAAAGPPAMAPVIRAAQGLIDAEAGSQQPGGRQAWSRAVWSAHDALRQFYRWRLRLASEAMKKQQDGGQHEAG